MNSGARMSVGIFIFDDVEVLDFAGPFEVSPALNRAGPTTAHPSRPLRSLARAR
jgi:hypothetical protein